MVGVNVSTDVVMFPSGLACKMNARKDEAVNGIVRMCVCVCLCVLPAALPSGTKEQPANKQPARARGQSLMPVPAFN